MKYSKREFVEHFKIVQSTASNTWKKFHNRMYQKFDSF